MFAQHQPQIAEIGACPEGFKRVCVFVLATIRCALPQAVEATKLYCRTGERMNIAFFGAKHDGLDYLEARGGQLFAMCRQDAIGAPLGNAYLMRDFLSVPGIGVAKAGFLCQLLYGQVGCLDTHNVVRFGLTGRLRADQKTEVARWRHILAYIELCERFGGCETLWDGWCEYVAKLQGYGTPDEVSAMHLEAVR